MKNNILRLFGVVILIVVLVPKDSSGLIIYRFGGDETLPLPPEVGSEGVVFKQLSWSDWNSSQGGEAFQLDMDGGSIRALELDPQDNIAPDAKEKGGVYRETEGVAFDGDYSTGFETPTYLCADLNPVYYSCDGDFWSSTSTGNVNIDLGGLLIIDRIVLVSGLGDLGRIVRNLRVHLSPKVPKPAARAGLARPFIEIRDNRKQFLEVKWPPQRVAFLHIAIAEHSEVWEIAEVEVYARGFFEKSSYVSNIIDLENPTAWGDIRWSGSRDLGAKVLIQTRSGSDDDPNLYWKFTGNADEKTQVTTKSQYKKLKVGERAGITYDRNNWTFWSPPYDFADSLVGTPIVSLSPRRFFQFKVDILPKGESGGGVDFLEFRTSVPPVASELVGEISPIQVEVGKVSRFTYAFKPIIEGDDTGFDRLEMTTSSIIASVDSVRIADVAVPFEVEALEENRFEVSFPKVEKNYTGLLIEVVFGAKVLRFGSSFNARVFDSSRPLEVHQVVNPGNAADELGGDRVSVVTSVEDKSLLEVSVSPVTFTPNGDGINDIGIISYDIFEITGSVSVIVEIRDLSGRLVRRVYSGDDLIGPHEREWDGRDVSGEIVPPGVYVYQISVDTDKGKTDKVGTIDVAY